MFDYLKDIYDITEQNNSKWITFGSLTKKDPPRHPLYLPINSKIFDFHIINYIGEKAKI